MKEFFKMMFASMLGFFLACAIVSIIFIGIVASALSFAKKQVVTVPEKTVLQLTLDQPVNDRASDNPLTYLSFDKNFSKPMGLTEILESLKKAKSDEKISGIFLNLDEVPASIATIEEIRNSLLDFKKSGKFIISYSEGYSQKAYYLASVSDKIYLNPAGSMQFKGLAGQVMFFKGLLEKLDVEPQIIRHGKFKSAVEPFILDKMSEPSKEQTRSFVTAIWTHMLEGISQTRKISTEELTAIADNHKIQTPEDAVNNKLIDKLMYKDQLIDELKTRTGAKEVKDINLMKLSKYMDAPEPEKKDGLAKDRIAVVYAQGNIISGEGDETSIGSERISKAIRKARTDDKIKAIVFRVNSPGGSALASDVIWREVELAQKVKPVVVSMGDLAASGGYYISCAATKIYASPNTLTGSIGVFGIVPNMQKFFNNNLGITFDEVKTNPYADYIPSVRPMTDAEKNFLTADIENIYSTFLKHVSEGRKMDVAAVDSIGQGRVWSGVDAKRIGLIDEFGGLQAAIDEAAKLAKIEKYRLVKLPEQKDTMTQIMEALSGDQTSAMLKKQLGTVYPYLKYLQAMSHMEGVQALMPFEINIQ
jgi:protease-4